MVDTSPVETFKAKKNAAEVAGIVAAGRRDAAAIVAYIAWLEAKLSGHESIPFERRSFLQRAMLETIEGRLVSLATKGGAASSNLDVMDEEEAHNRRLRAASTRLDELDEEE